MTNMSQTFKKFFKDNHGKVVIFQKPNALLIAWGVLRILLLLPVTPALANLLESTAFAFLVGWAFLELSRGVNYFRKLLGFAVLFFTIMSKF